MYRILAKRIVPALVPTTYVLFQTYEKYFPLHTLSEELVYVYKVNSR